MSPSEKTQARPGGGGKAGSGGQTAPRGAVPEHLGGGPRATTGSTAAQPRVEPAERGQPRTEQATTAQPRAAAERPAAARPAGTPEEQHDDDSPRHVRLTVAKLDLWSVAKLAFLLSVALGIVLVVAVAVVWTLLNAMGVFSDVEGLLGEVLGTESGFDLMAVIGLSRVVSLAVFVAVVDVVLITALATLGAFLYNSASSLVGGLRLTLSDD